MKRIEFIPELQATLAKALAKQGMNQRQIDESFRKWHANEKPVTPYERGAFEMFRTVQKELDDMPDDEATNET